VFGEATDSVVRGFQDIYDVPPGDGIVGPETWHWLIGS
jgi:peptidoglycan hydrolase-like protein with peptidoglycan-binding domain